MNGFSVDIKNDINFPEITQEVKQIIQDELNGFGVDTVEDAKNFANSSVDRGFLHNQISFDPIPNQLAIDLISAAPYSAYIEFGTRGLAAAYVSSLPANWQQFAAQYKGGSGGSFAEFLKRIMEWVKRKGIDEAAAYPIAKKIMIEGIRPQPFLYPAIVKNVPLLIDNLKKQLG